jgi:hypothetical protein
MKSTNGIKPRKFLLTVLICFTVYLSLAPGLLDFNPHRPFAGECRQVLRQSTWR